MVRTVEIAAFGCPPARHVGHLVTLLQEAGMTPFVTCSPSATKWVPIDQIEDQTGFPVRVQFRGAEESKSVPEPDAFVACAITVNSVNKWAMGVCDTLALAAAVEAVGRKIPTVAVPFSTSAARAHPAFARSLEELARWGVTFPPVGAAEESVEPWKNTADDSPWTIAAGALQQLIAT